ncbi:MAG TPA: hypothetical protein VKY73_12320 [Polyangiaceae bacterium]|nr:hypothetical protein [Polyangiaceae bacterium]
MKPRAILAWSSGKDSAYALHVLRERAEVDVVALFTTITAPFARVSMHGVRIELLREQAARAGLPLWEVEIPSPCSNREYETAMRGLVDRALRAGVERIAFGDLFLEDVRRYREERLSGTGLSPMFPLWGIPTATLATEMLSAGVEAVLTCIDPRKVPRALAGSRFDRALVDALPPEVDPCGENGEFHTFVIAGPMLSAPLAVDVGPTVERDGFLFTDVRPA